VGNYGLKVSKKGDDVNTTVPKSLRFDSEYSTLKIYKWGNATISTNGSGTGSVTIPHDLGYAPGFFVFRKGTAQWTLFSATTYADSFFPLGAVNQYVYGDTKHDRIQAYATSTSLIINADATDVINSTIYLRYYILVDRSELFSTNSTISLPNNVGFKIAKTGYDVTSPEYQMVYSSKYKALQYYAENKQTSTITLPETFASFVDTEVESASYVDFAHGLGYAPFFIAYAEGSNYSSNELFQIPRNVYVNDTNAYNNNVSGFSDSTRVRIYWYRRSFQNQVTRAVNSFPAETLTIHLYIFTENLAGMENP